MKTIDKSPQKFIFVGSYTNENLHKLFERKDIANIHPLLKISNFLEDPRYLRYRTALEIKCGNDPRNYIRRANLMELIHFALRNPSVLAKYGCIVGSEDKLFISGNESQTKTIYPIAVMDNGKIYIEIIDEKLEKYFHKLVVTHFMNCSQ